MRLYIDNAQRIVCELTQHDNGEPASGASLTARLLTLDGVELEDSEVALVESGSTGVYAAMRPQSVDLEPGDALILEVAGTWQGNAIKTRDKVAVRHLSGAEDCACQ